MATRPITTGEILAIGSELLVGETRDTNSGDLAAELTSLVVEITRIVVLPDRLPEIIDALAAARERAELVITGGGLGPTPDDLTREAIAGLLGLTPSVDAVLERWLRELWATRGIPFPETNLKQAWLIPGAQALANPNGTAPGWWVEAGANVIVALPGPPREMRPMWADHVLPMLRARGLGADRAAQTLRLTGIGESAVADLLGEELLSGTHPHVATYARLDAVDVRIWATGDGKRTAQTLVDDGEAVIRRILAPYIFGRGSDTWIDVLGPLLGDRRVACLEAGTGAQLASLLGTAPWLVRAELVTQPFSADRLVARCTELREGANAHVGLAVAAADHGEDMAVEIVVDVGGEVTTSDHTAFRGGDIGRRRAANTACAELWRRLTVAEAPS